MNEQSKFILLFVFTLAIGIAGAVFLTPQETQKGAVGNFEDPLIVDSYTVTWHENGSLTETYVYNVRVDDEFRMLYRIWKVPLIFGAADNSALDGAGSENGGNAESGAHIKYLGYEITNPDDCPAGSMVYVKTDSGKVNLNKVGGDNWYYTDADHTTGVDSSTDGYAGSYADSYRLVEDSAMNNEVGLINPSYFKSGKYTVTYKYSITPPVEYSDDAIHINMMFADEHIPYNNVQINLVSDKIIDVFMHPPTYTVVNNAIAKITGSSDKDSLIEAEFLMTPDAKDTVKGVYTHVADAKSLTKSANDNYQFGQSLGSTYVLIGKVLAILIPILIAVIYFVFGREKKFVVPQYLSTIPNSKLTPSQVNQLFKGDATLADEDGFYATLLLMAKNRLISIKEKPDKKGILITLLEERADDPYQQKILNFISMNTDDNDVFDTSNLENAVKSAGILSENAGVIEKLQKNLLELTKNIDTKLSESYIVSGREKVALLFLVSITYFIIGVVLAVFFSYSGNYYGTALLLGLVCIIQSSIATFMQPSFFGHWKDDHYKEKLEWDSFAAFLSDLSQIKKYSPSDLNMWGEWLIYGTALGVGDSVRKAMKELNVVFPDDSYFCTPTYFWFAGFHTMSTYSSSSASGGGFGAGGGFGGGGAGGR